MGLPDKIKNALSTVGNKPQPTDQTPAKSHKNQPPARNSKRSITDGLSAFKEPPLPEGTRAILVACATTRRASWAVLRNRNTDNSPYWVFERNIPAVPDTSSAKPATRPRKDHHGSDSAGDPDGFDTQVADMHFSGYSCGVCGADGSHGAVFVRCVNCNTLQCQPASSWSCPGCGAGLGDRPMQDMTSLSTSAGSSPNTRPTRPGISASDHGAESAIENSTAIPAANHGRKRT